MDQVYETLEEKDRIIDQLRESNLFTYENSPTSLNLSEIKSILTGIQEELDKLNQNAVYVNDAYKNEQADTVLEIKKKHDEVSDYRDKLAVYEGKKFESEISTLRIDLHKALCEKSHAKRLIIAYVRSVQILEKMVSEKNSFSLDDQIATLQLENSRLQEENQSLIEICKKTTDNYDSEMKSLQNVIDNQFIKLQDFQAKTEGSSKARLKMISEQTHAWELRQKTLNELNKQLNTQVGFIEAKSLIELQHKEIQNLKNKLELSKRGVIQLRERWEKQREDMRNEILSLKQKIVALENKDQHTTQELNKHYRTIITNSNENLKLEQIYLSDFKLQNENLVKFYQSFDQTQVEISKTAQHLLKILKKECEITGKEIINIRNMHQEEMEFIKETGPFAELQKLKETVKEKEMNIKDLEDYIRSMEDKHTQEIDSFFKLDTSDIRKKNSLKI